MFGQLINKKKAGTKDAPWDSVRNYQAVKNLKGMKKEDFYLFYHSNIGKEIVSIVEVILVGLVGYAPTTPSMSTRYSTIELQSHSIIY